MNKIISPNMLKTYKTCPKKFQHKFIDRLNLPLSISPFEKGKRIHALANYYLQGINIEKIIKELNDEELFLWNRLLQNEFFNLKCINSEYKLSFKFNDKWLGGRIDALMTDNKLNYYILDYKTGATPQNPTYDFQTIIYFLAIYKKFKNINSLNFIYINLRDNTNTHLIYNEKLENEYTKILQNILQTIDNNEFNTMISNQCKICEYNKICLK